MKLTLKDLFDALGHGELSQVYIGRGDADGCIPRESYAALANSVSLGLTALYKRFLLQERTLLLEHDGMAGEYTLSRDFAQSNTSSTQPVKYINDSTAPFLGDLLRVEKVEDAQGCPQVLNKEGNACSFFTPNYETLRAPVDIPPQTLKITYRANHPPLDLSRASSVPADVPIYLPPDYLQALYYFVASRVLNPVGLSQEFHEGNNYMAKFEAECLRLATGSPVMDLNVEPTRAEMKGWC